MQVACDILLEALDKGYNFALDLITIGGLHIKLWAPKFARVPNVGRDYHLEVPGQNAIWMWASRRGTKYTIRGKMVASPQVRVVVSLVSLNLLVARLSTKSVSIMHQLSFCLVCANPCE